MIVAGIGCRRNASADDVLAALDLALAAVARQRGDVRALATVEGKAAEAGIAAAAIVLAVPVQSVTLAQAQLVAPQTLTNSATVMARFGLPSVAECAALAVAGPGAALLGARVSNRGASCALARPGSAAP